MNKDISITTTITLKTKDQEIQLNNEEANVLLYQLKQALGDDKTSYPYNPYPWLTNPIITTPSTGDKYPPYTLSQTWCSTGAGTDTTTSTIKFL
jgi:hypothetical protein